MAKRKGLKLILLFFVLILLIGGYVGVSILTKEPEEVEETEEESIEVNKIDQESIDKISFTGEKGSMTLVLKDENWYYTEDESCPINQYKVTAMLSALAEVKGSREIAKEEVDEKEFGLDNPSMEISFTQKDGTETKYTLGVLNSVISEYYFRMSGNDKVYTIDTTMYNSFDYDLLGLVSLEEYPAIGQQDIIDFTLVKGKRQVYYYDKADAAHKKNTANIPDCKWYAGTSKKDAKKIEADTASELTQAIINLTNSGCVNYDCSKKELKEYGLDKPALELTVRYTETSSAEEEEADKEKTETETEIIEKEFGVYFGGKSKSGEYYVRKEGSNAIYTMNVSGVDTLMQALESK